MKKNFLAVVLTLVLIMQLSFCYAAQNDAWKENIGTINLDTMTVTGNGISVNDNTFSITAGGNFEVTGVLSDGMIYVKSDEKVKLRLSGMSLTNSKGPAIYFDNADKALITISENTENYLADGKTYTVDDADAPLFSNDDLEIKGSGTLTITGNYQHGIAGDDDVSIENGNIIINSYEHGIMVNDTLSVSGGKINIISQTGKGMKAEFELIIDDGDINITSMQSEGIESKGIMTINGGNINITAEEDGLNTGNPDAESTSDAIVSGGKSMFGANVGMERPQGDNRAERGMNSDASAPGGRNPRDWQNNGERIPGRGFEPKSEMHMNSAGAAPADIPLPPDGEFGRPGPGGMAPGEKPDGIPRFDGEMPPDMPVPSDAMNPDRGGFGGFVRLDEETAAAHAITINDGTIYINANGDGIDSNGNLTINGGHITIDGPLNAGNGPLDCDGTMSINGGTLVLASSMGMMQLPRSSDGQNILSVSFEEKQNQGTEVVIKEKQSGDEIVSYSPQKTFQAFVVSDEKIIAGNEYVIYANGTEYKTVTAQNGTTTVGNAMGMGGGRGGFGGNRGGNRANQRQNIRVNLDGKNVRFDTEPVAKNGTTLVGFRAILEALGAEVSWEQETQTVTAKKDGTEIELQIGSPVAKVNGVEKTLLLAPEIINNSTMIPIRFASEELNKDVSWDGNANLITITSR